MGRRGRYKAGYYLSLLYVLELQYQLEARARGPEPLKWRPSPRNRPDQFLEWVVSSANLLGGFEGGIFESLRECLEMQRLPCIGQVLEAVIVRQLGKAGGGHKVSEKELRALDVTAVQDLIALPRNAVEAHPQVRKVANFVGHKLDASWLDALVHGGSRTAVTSSTFLGSLPPGFWELHQVLESVFEREGSPVPCSELTVLQFYSLVTGALLRPPLAWRPALHALQSVRHDELLSLKPLTAEQLRQLARLDDGAHETIRFLRKHRRRVVHAREFLGQLAGLRDSQFEALCEALESTTGGTARIDPGFSRWAGHLPDLRSLRRLCSRGKHRPLSGLDDEVWRLVDRGILSFNLLRRIRRWDEELTGEVHALLQQHWVWASLYLEDVAQYSSLVESRGSAVLYLRELFPSTVEWLNERSKGLHPDAVFEYVDSLASRAAEHSERLRTAVLSA